MHGYDTRSGVRLWNVLLAAQRGERRGQLAAEVARQLAPPARRPRVGTGSHQRAHGVGRGLLAADGRPVQRRQPLPVAQRGVGAVAQQHAHQLRRAELGGGHERRPPLPVGLVDRVARRQQRLGHLDLPLREGGASGIAIAGRRRALRKAATAASWVLPTLRHPAHPRWAHLRRRPHVRDMARVGVRGEHQQRRVLAPLRPDGQGRQRARPGGGHVREELPEDPRPRVSHRLPPQREGRGAEARRVRGARRASWSAVVLEKRASGT
jgi:hypothetical protein